MRCGLLFLVCNFMETWQTELNAIYYTQEKLFCDDCKKQKKTIIQINNFGFFCDNCFKNAFERYFGFNLKKEFVRCKMIIDTIFDNRKEIKKKERAKMILKLRYKILKRDNFKCVLCGNTANDCKIEVDHIKALDNGGKTIESNLRTLCFDCNHGKGVLN